MKPKKTMEICKIIRLGSNYTMTAITFVYYFLHLRGTFDVIVEEIMGGPRIPIFASLYMKKKDSWNHYNKGTGRFFDSNLIYQLLRTLSLLERFLVIEIRE